MKIIKVEKIATEQIKLLDGTAEKANAIRQLREPLLDAFDIYKTNVQYGIETESKEQHNSIISWYQRLLNLDESALRDVPTPIEKYVRE